MINIFDIVPSKDYRKFLTDHDIELSDWNKATLIYNHSIATYEDKIGALTNLKESTSDEVLKRQIDERIARDSAFYERFKENDGNAYYVVCRHYEKVCIEGYTYLSFESAYKDGIKNGYDFRIEKHLFKCKENIGESQGVFGCVEFDSEGKRNNRVWLYTISDDDPVEPMDNSRFEDRYIDLPVMFRQKDIVHIVGTNLYGIVEAPANDEQELYFRNSAKNDGYYGFQVTVNIMYDGDKFLPVITHEHLSPTDIEFAEFEEGDTREGFLKYMVKTLYEKRGLFGPGRSSSRISEVLSKIEIVWRQYPNMRLGQLLVNVCGEMPLNLIEDEDLMERLQCNIFPIEG